MHVKTAILCIVLLMASGTRKASIRSMESPENYIAPVTDSTLTLFLCGDVMTGRGIDQVLPYSVNPRIYESFVKDARDYVRLAVHKNGPIPKQVAFKYIWGDALEVWQQEKPDLKIINLETSVTKNPTPWPGKEVQYRMHPGNIEVLTAAGIDFCTLANNHTLDWGRPGLEESVETLTNAKITFAGAGLNADQAQKPAILKTPMGRVIVLAYGSQTSGIPTAWAAGRTMPGINLLPDLSDDAIRIVQKQVKSIKQAGDVVVVSIHWGGNWGYTVPGLYRTFAHRLIEEAKVDLVHGHSSHHPMGMEVYQGKLIMYGAGDFINDYEGISGHEAYRGDLVLMYFPKIDMASGNLKSLKMIPLQVRNFKLHYAKATDARWLKDTLNFESTDFGTHLELGKDGALLLKW